MQNMVEVAVTLRILQLLYKECASSKQKLSIAILSPYPAQIQCMQQKLENHYHNHKFFKVNVGCTYNYEGGRVDVVIISTVGVDHGDECIDLNTQNTNVYFTWARYCLWILGDEKVHLKERSIWGSLILDAKARGCFFQADEHKDLAKARFGAQRGSEFPMKWPEMSSISQYKSHANGCDDEICVENVNVSESLMLMKFYSLSSWAVNSMIFGCDGEAIGLPFELTEQEKDVVSFDKSSFILGRSGTGKTTVLTMKLFQNEQLHHLACEGFHDAVDQRNEEVNQDALHQLFVTFSPKLCHAVREQFDQWKRLTCGGSLSAESSSVSIDDIDKTMLFEDIPDHFIHLPHDAYPLIITFHKFLLMLDGTVGTSYFERFPCIRKHSTSRLVFLEQNMRSMDVTYEKFCSRYWPHFNEKMTKNLYPSMVYTEIMSVIKGGLTTGDQAPSDYGGILSRDDYVALCDGRTSILDAQKRQIIYAIFLQYEKKKTEKGDFDLADLVNDLHRRLEVEGYNGDPIDYVYIDEVQDLSMRQIALFKYVCTNVHEGFAFCGDTAQAIAKGIGFRFEDIRCLFFRMFLSGPEKGQISKIVQLSDNFRTHVGVLNLAQSVIDLLFHFFPLFVDHLSPETSRIHGDLPILLETDINNNALKTIFGMNGDGCQQFTGFGAEQVVLVRDERLKEKVVDIIGKKSLVLTIMESKGLEFQDVLLYDFFSTSSFSNEWRIIYEYMKEKGPPNLPSTELSSSFNMEKHNVLCSELKQLYVAITRTRQRLWICETMGFSQPIYDYWKKLSLVEVRSLNDSFADKMQIRSSEDDWKLRGVKLFCEKNYIMAEMCFLKAGDKNSARLAEAYHLRALADGHQASQLERKKLFKDAAKLFREIGKIELAAECFYEMEDFKSMMECVGSFCSKHEMRSFLTKKRCLAELILLEIKWGNFEEAVNVARLKPDPVVEADLLLIGGLHRESSLIILWHILSNSPLFQGADKPIAQKNELLAKAASIAKSDSAVFDQLRAIADSPPASKLESKKLFKDAAKLFREIGKNELAAQCFYKIEDYRTAGDIYESESMLEKAGNCFCLAKCYELAVEAYDKAGACAKCLLACSDGNLFEIGFQLIGRWGGCGDAELEFYHNAAYYYFDVKDSNSMMKCVRSFRSKDDMRLFLAKKHCLDELIFLEREWGNFVEAAKVASLKPDPVLQADLLRMGGLYRESSLIILWHVFSNSIIFQSAEKPLFTQKDEFLKKAVSIAKSDSDVFYQFVCKEAEILSKGKTQEDLLKNGLEFLYWYKNNTLSMSLERVKTTHEIEKIEKEVLDLLRSLFKSGNRLDELLLLEEVRGDFVGAAKIGIEDDHSLEAALRRLWYVFFGSLWSRGKRAWPLKDFNQKDNLLDGAKSYLEYHPDSEDSALVHTEIGVLSSLEINLSQMWRYLRKTPRERSLRIQFLISRRILDVHLHSCSEVYACIQTCNVNHGATNHLEGVFSQDIISVEGLIYFWSYWKGLILNLINWAQVGKGSKIYEDFIFNYFGVRRYDREDPNGFYVVLDAEAQWVKQMNPVMCKNGYFYITPAHRFPSVASRYWCSELLFVAEKMLNKLNTFHTYSTVKNFPIHQQTKILTGLFEVARSLQKCKLPNDWIRASRIVHRSFQLCVDKFLSNVFDIDWKNAQSKEMISLRGNETFLNMLEEAVNIKSKSGKDLTCGQLGTIAMIFLGSRIGVNDDIKRKVRACSSMNWRDLFDKLNGNGTKSGNLAIGLHNVLKEAFCGGWRVDGCMSTACFLYLMERLLILSFGFNGYVFTTRSSCVEWLANAHEDWSMGGSNGAMKNIHHSLASMVSEMLNSEDDLMEWLTRSKDSSSSSYAILVLRLTLLLSLICANSGQHYYHLLLDLLQRCHFVSFLPSGFHEALIKGLKEDHLVDALAVACKEIDNPLVVMSFTNDFSESLCQNAIFLEMTLSREMVIEVLYP
ncbi:hypothetical protein L6452_18327 [Arctium lappa]|uniref:Uncharacterized protein n=1 Tax=Arctium lappa TaxID=4217 RepID=A0ACB9C5U6_ARCLA|nr:hypothetical protein L6452_18327 [Arctium lappa]